MVFLLVIRFELNKLFKKFIMNVTTFSVDLKIQTLRTTSILKIYHGYYDLHLQGRVSLFSLLMNTCIFTVSMVQLSGKLTSIR